MGGACLHITGTINKLSSLPKEVEEEVVVQEESVVEEEEEPIIPEPEGGFYLLPEVFFSEFNL